MLLGVESLFLLSLSLLIFLCARSPERLCDESAGGKGRCFFVALWQLTLFAEWNWLKRQGQQVVDKDYVHFPHSLPLLVVHGEGDLVSGRPPERDVLDLDSVACFSWFAESDLVISIPPCQVTDADSSREFVDKVTKEGVKDATYKGFPGFFVSSSLVSVLFTALFAAIL